MKFNIGTRTETVAEGPVPVALPEAPLRKVIIEKANSVLELPLSIPTLPYFNCTQDLLRMQHSDDVDNDVQSGNVYNLIFIIGCGGTGGYVVRDLARYISTLSYASKTIMVLMDGDTVEQRNTIRQNFITKDVGKNKAEVLATRYGNAFGLHMIAVPNHLTNLNMSNILSSTGLCNFIRQEFAGTRVSASYYGAPRVNINLCIISCVDNNKTRALISGVLGLHEGEGTITTLDKRVFTIDALRDADIATVINSITWIDSGNETNAGQVVVYYDTLFTESQQMQHENWTWVGAGSNNGIYFEADSYPRPCIISDSKHSTGFDNIATYLKALDYTNYKRNIDTRYQFDRQGVLVRKMIKTYDPFSENAQSQAQIITGMIRNGTNFYVSGFFTFPITWVYPDVLANAKDKTNLEMSCTERAVVDPQNLMVNLQAASHIIYFASKIFAANPKAAQLDSFGCTWKGSDCKEFKLTKTNIEKVLDKANLKKVWPSVAWE